MVQEAASSSLHALPLIRAHIPPVNNLLQARNFHSRVQGGAEAYCAANGWDIMFLSFNSSANTPSEELHLPKVVQRRDVVRALILAGTNSDNLIKLLDLRGIP